ncbi:MAG: ABC transporter permease [Chitinispirillia bacterium]|nr:ABC transporter permease [Chitinispirillia bacterium]
MKKNFGPFYVAPMTLWIMAFVIAPISIIIVYSFMTKHFRGGAVTPYTLDAYRNLFNPVFFRVTLNTLWVAVVSTILMVALAVPAAYFMARSRYKNFFLMLVIIPFWTNIMIRIFAWREILGSRGVLNNLLITLGLIEQPIQFLFNTNAVILITVYAYLPFAILPLYSTIEKFDFSLLEAARDLGASKFTATRRILFPNIRAGITTAVLFTFIPAFGSYAIPNLIGGNNSFMLGNLIAHELNTARNYPLASSMSVVLTLLTMIGVLIFLRVNRSSVEAVREESGKRVSDPTLKAVQTTNTPGAQ